ncbi:MAG TPA: metallophosphoesterase family protein [Anaerolineales bacterium]|nr:metallophosphoesterase family protein [Anaerolineales bacterium]HRF49224.1 metallophosphoesterase family protein [Anaerolineales bacterium]
MTIKRWAVLADIHGNRLALEAVIADLDRESARQPLDGVINLGDHLSGPLWPAETLALVMRQKWIHLSGNHDRQLAQLEVEAMGASDRYARARLTTADLTWLRALPRRVSIEDEILAFHGTPEDDCGYLLETVVGGRAQLASTAEIEARLGRWRAPLMLCAHTHQPRVITLGEGRLVVNPGSVGLPAYETDDPVPHIAETGCVHARYAVVEQTASGWRVALQAVSYDHLAAARQAAANGRPDWEIALRTGRMAAPA